MDSRASFLKGVSIFSALSPSDLDRLAQHFEAKTFKDKSAIISEGEASEGVYVIQKGFVNVFRSSSSRPIFLCTLGEKDIFGEAALFADLKRTATIEAKGDVSVLFVARDQFVSYLKSNAQAGNQVLLEMLRRVFLRLQQTTFELRTQRDKDMSQEAIDKLFV